MRLAFRGEHNRQKNGFHLVACENYGYKDNVPIMYKVFVHFPILFLALLVQLDNKQQIYLMQL